MIADYHLFVNRDLPILERGCTSKVAYVSRREARAQLSHGHRQDGRMEPYHCRSCGRWHTGHRKRGHG